MGSAAPFAGLRTLGATTGAAWVNATQLHAGFNPRSSFRFRLSVRTAPRLLDEVSGQEFSSFQPEPFKGIGVLACNNVLAPGASMNTAERFLRFAAECEAMAKFSHSRENKTVWHQLAQRWVQIADLVERQNTLLVDAAGRMKRPRKRRHGWAH